jgi:hypothetical protein
MASVLRLELMSPRMAGAAVKKLLPQSSANPRAFLNALINVLAGIFTGAGARVRAQIDESTPYAATGAVAFTQASLTAGDKVFINGAALTAVAGSAVAANGEFSKDTSNTAVGDSFVLALAAYPPVKDLVTGVNSSGTVTLAAKTKGAVGNSIKMSEVDASGGIALTQFSGGLDPGSLVSVNGTFSNTGTANDTISIGGVTLTLKASAANENEITIGGSAAATATNTINVINAHSKLKGLVVASSGGSGIVTVQLQQSGRVGNLVTLTEASSQFSWAATSFAPTSTEAWVTSTVTYGVGWST